MKGVLRWLVRWVRLAGTRVFCPALAALVGPVQNILLLTVHYFTSFVPIVQQAVQAVVPRRLSLYIHLWSEHYLSHRTTTMTLVFIGERLHCKRPIPICRLFFKIDLFRTLRHCV